MISPDEFDSVLDDDDDDLDEQIADLEVEVDRLEQKLEESISPNVLIEIRKALLAGDIEWAIELIGREIGY